LLVWQRLILPDGASIHLDNLPATDAAGYAGLADKVNFHIWQLLKGGGLSTLLGAGTEIRFGDDTSDLVRAIRQSPQQSGSQARARSRPKSIMNLRSNSANLRCPMARRRNRRSTKSEHA
jgi:type IV secretory pathway VirB10-like protein